MAVVVVGGHTRNIGKTSVAAGLIAALREWRWTAIKVTQFGHGVCSANGRPCGCETADHSVAISEERGESPETDSGRFLTAGAERSLWVRTRQGQLFAAMPRLRREIASAENVLIESNSVLQFIRPELYLSVLDLDTADFKRSARIFLDRADVILFRADRASSIAGDAAVSLRRVARRVPWFPIAPPRYLSEDVVQFVAARLTAATAGAAR